MTMSRPLTLCSTVPAAPPHGGGAIESDGSGPADYGRAAPFAFQQLRWMPGAAVRPLLDGNCLIEDRQTELLNRHCCTAP